MRQGAAPVNEMFLIFQPLMFRKGLLVAMSGRSAVVVARQINGSHTYQRGNVAARLAVALVTSLLTLCASEAATRAFS